MQTNQVDVTEKKKSGNLSGMEGIEEKLKKKNQKDKHKAFQKEKSILEYFLEKEKKLLYERKPLLQIFLMVWL